MSPTLELLIAQVEGAIPEGWQWLLRMVNSDETFSNRGRYFAHIYDQRQTYLHSHKGLGDDPYEALLNAFTAFEVEIGRAHV